jgi:exodeoxyribonuclease VII small subunit
VDREEAERNNLEAVQICQEDSETPFEGLCFEEILSRLQKVVQDLEEGSLPLEKALETFETGIRLARVGSRRLDEAERRVEILLSDQEGIKTIPLDKEPEIK